MKQPRRGFLKKLATTLGASVPAAAFVQAYEPYTHKGKPGVRLELKGFKRMIWCRYGEPINIAKLDEDTAILQCDTCPVVLIEEPIFEERPEA